MNNPPPILYVDMDDVLCDYTGAHKQFMQTQPGTEYPQSIPGFFESLEPMDLAIASFVSLAGKFDTYILSAPSVKNPHSYTEKRLWVEKHLGNKYTDRLILASNKALLKGDYLIDDYDSGRGQEDFEGELIHFGSNQYPDWKSVTDYLKTKKT